MNNDFIQAWSETRQPPCETCLYRKHCSDEREACELFARYVGMELPVKKHYLQVPNTKWYNMIFTDFVPYDEEIHGQ